MQNIDIINGNAFNIGGGLSNSLSLIELMDLLGNLLNCRLIWSFVSARESDQRIFIADLTKINKFINWYPKISKSEGIEKMIIWVKNNI